MPKGEIEAATTDPGVGTTDPVASPAVPSNLDNLKQAQAALAVAEGVLREREGALDTLIASLAGAKDEVARLDALEELTQKEVVAEQNARRKVRRLESDLQHSENLVEAAKNAVESADREVAVWRLATLDDELTGMDADFISDAKETAKRFGEKRAAIFAKLREAHALNHRLRPGADWSHRTSLAGIPTESSPPMEAAQETLIRVAAIERQQQLDSPGDYVRPS